MYKISKFYQSSKKLALFRKIIGIILYVILVPIIVVNLTLAIKSYINPNETPDFFGYKSFVIVSESMEPTIMTNDAIIVKEVKENELKEKDIISFQDGDIINTHRIVKISDENGIREYTTKGDNNLREDRQKITFSKIEGKYILKIKGFGTIVQIMKNKVTLVCLLIILILLSIQQVRLSKRRLERKQKRYEYKKSKMENN